VLSNIVDSGGGGDDAATTVSSPRRRTSNDQTFNRSTTSGCRTATLVQRLVSATASSGRLPYCSFGAPIKT